MDIQRILDSVVIDIQKIDERNDILAPHIDQENGRHYLISIRRKGYGYGKTMFVYYTYLPTSEQPEYKLPSSRIVLAGLLDDLAFVLAHNSLEEYMNDLGVPNAIVSSDLARCMWAYCKEMYEYVRDLFPEFGIQHHNDGSLETAAYNMWMHGE